MEKKIGILTFHNCVNYGAVMQAYGLQEFLRSKGYRVEIIDYVNDVIDAELNAPIPKDYQNPKSIIKFIAKSIHRKRKSYLFNKFNNMHLRLSSSKNIRRKNVGIFRDEYDFIITGSDQVWNINITGIDRSYFLDFCGSNTKKIGYSVSVGDISNINLNDVLDDIRSFDAISVREKSFMEYASLQYGIETSLCCDPTILAGKEIYLDIKSQRLLKKKYLFCFLMEDKPELMEVASRIAKENNWTVIDNKSSYEFFLHSKPDDFLSWIYYAEAVLTDSFHGTVFSFLFNKQFISDKYDGKGIIKSRVGDLLAEIGLSRYHMKVSLDNYTEIKKAIKEKLDYKIIEDKIYAFSLYSKQWLINTIEGNTYLHEGKTKQSVQ